MVPPVINIEDDTRSAFTRRTKRPANDVRMDTDDQPTNTGKEQRLAIDFLKSKISQATTHPADPAADGNDSSDEENQEQRFAAALFPSIGEVRRNQVMNLSEAMELNHVYFVLGGKQSTVAFENESGEVVRGPSMIVKVMDCALEYSPENVRKVRLYGVSYEKLMNEGNYETFKEIDDYYLTYDGMVDSVRDPSHRYHKLNVLHGPRGLSV